MIGYVTLGTNDLDAAASFYDELFASIGAGRVLGDERFVAWATDPKAPAISIIKPFNGSAATAGNGVMVAIRMKSPQQVDAFHAKALELGSDDEGAPGLRSGGFYVGYFRDLDGNKLNAYCLVSEQRRGAGS